MSLTLLACPGGALRLPDRDGLLADRGDGGHLLVDPPRPVWERSELTPDELKAWACLVAASGWAMLDALPSLAGGCINYWEAGNWALNDHAEPIGAKTAPAYRRVHLHLIGRSPRAKSEALRWGEAPGFPRYAERHAWSAGHAPLTAEECAAVLDRTCRRLRDKYGVADTSLAPGQACVDCGYPAAPRAHARCPECLAGT